MEAPLAKEKFIKMVQKRAKGKNPSLDGLMAELFQSYWSFTSRDFTRIINESLASDRFQKG